MCAFNGPRIRALARYFTSAFASVKYLSQRPHPRAKTWNKIWMTGLYPTNNSYPIPDLIYPTHVGPLFGKFVLKKQLAFNYIVQYYSVGMDHFTQIYDIGYAALCVPCANSRSLPRHTTPFSFGAATVVVLAHFMYYKRSLWTRPARRASLASDVNFCPPIQCMQSNLSYVLVIQARKI